MKFADVIQTADWKAEKHVPVIEAPDRVKADETFDVKVCVGAEISHPNTTEHHISWIKLYFKPANSKFAQEVASFAFTAHGADAAGPNKGAVFSQPAAQATLKLATSGTLLAEAYCNIHGLWENAVEITVA